MTPIQTTLIIGIGALIVTYVLTILLYYRWWKVSQQAIVMALGKQEVTERQLNKMLKKIRLYANGIRYCRQLTLQIPILMPILVGALIVTYLV